MTAHTVKQVQQELIRQGYDVGPTGADGFGGKNTSKAVAKFEADHVLIVTGRITSTIFLDALFHPQPVKDILMFPNIVRLAVSLLPGLPDDVNKIRASIGELVTDAADKNGIEGLRDAARFARVLADEMDKVANALDPSGAIQPANPIVNK